MFSQNTNLYLIRHALSQLCNVVDRLIEQDSRIGDMQQKNNLRDSRITNLEDKCEEIMQRLDKQDTQLQKQDT